VVARDQGYVLWRSAGPSWVRPVVLGLREGAPYVVVPNSSLPMLQDRALVLEVQDARGVHSVIEADWVDLLRDSDADGLTDLEEQEWLMNPWDPDTDHDGLPDAMDPLPLLKCDRQRSSSSPGRTDRSDTGALAAVLLPPKVCTSSSRQAPEGSAGQTVFVALEDPWSLCGLGQSGRGRTTIGQSGRVIAVSLAEFPRIEAARGTGLLAVAAVLQAPEEGAALVCTRAERVARPAALGGVYSSPMAHGWLNARCYRVTDPEGRAEVVPVGGRTEDSFERTPENPAK